MGTSNDAENGTNATSATTTSSSLSTNSSSTSFLLEDYSVDSLLFAGVDYIVPGPQPPPALPPIVEDDDDDDYDDEANTAEAGTNNKHPRSSPNSQQQPSVVLWELPGATTYQLDSNGIQSSWVDTSFHRVARGMLPTPCCQQKSRSSHKHLPCEYCSYCWENPNHEDDEDDFRTSSRKQRQSQREHVMDSAAPLGGLVLHVSIRDKLEINLDAPTLDAIGTVLDLFQKPKPISTTATPTEKSAAALASDSDLVAHRAPAITLLDSGVRDGAKQHLSDPKKTQGLSRDHNPKADASAKDKRKEAFPTYMQPEKIQYLGLHIVDIQLRLHLIPASDPTTRIPVLPQARFSFCYWETNLLCLTADLQLLAGDKKNHDTEEGEGGHDNNDNAKVTVTNKPDEVAKTFQDIRLDVGHLTVTEFRGAQPHNGGTALATMGLRQRRVVDFDEVTVESLMTREEDCQRPPWPSTAAVLLDISPPLETLVYETRERHAIQLRYVAVQFPNDSAISSSSSSGEKSICQQAMVHVKVGASSVDIPSSIVSIVKSTIQQAKACVVPPPIQPTQKTNKQTKSNNETTTPSNSRTPSSPTTTKTNNNQKVLRYKVDLEGARVHLHPMVNVRLPLSTLTGELSSATGFAIDAVMDQLEVQYKHKSKMQPHEVPKTNSNQKLPLKALADLPESLRLRIFFFLDDLNPLASALAVKQKSSSLAFFVHKEINKQIDKLAARRRRKKAITSSFRLYDGSMSSNKGNRSSTSTSSRNKKSTSKKSQASASEAASQSSSSTTSVSFDRNQVDQSIATTSSRTAAKPGIMTHQDFPGDMDRHQRRQIILTELLKLTDEELGHLWDSHVLNQQQATNASRMPPSQTTLEQPPEPQNESTMKPNSSS
ncbi:hypothetical protein ACA910_021948 [Epithemia clementina (nom. ined.)]